MRILMIQPNDHAGDAQIAGHWPPGWVAYWGGALKTAGMDNVRFIKVEVRDYSKYNFVTAIMKPEGMTREQVLKGLLRIYARFCMRKSFLEYPWIKDKLKRRYLLGCLKAFARTTVTKKLCDLERWRYKGGLTTEVDLGFDESRVLTEEQVEDEGPVAAEATKARGPGEPRVATSAGVQLLPVAVETR